MSTRSGAGATRGAVGGADRATSKPAARTSACGLVLPAVSVRLLPKPVDATTTPARGVVDGEPAAGVSNAPTAVPVLGVLAVALGPAVSKAPTVADRVSLTLATDDGVSKPASRTVFVGVVSRTVGAASANRPTDTGGGVRTGTAGATAAAGAGGSGRAGAGSERANGFGAGAGNSGFVTSTGAERSASRRSVGRIAGSLKAGIGACGTVITNVSGRRSGGGAGAGPVRARRTRPTSAAV